jgi:O-antigen/teichoic acid export membrane protein
MDDKALQMGKSSTAGSFFLLIGIVSSTFILFLGTLILNRWFLTPIEVGLFSAVLIPSNIIAYFRDLGVNSAMTQKIASLRAAGKDNEVHDVIVSGVLFQLISGILFSLVCFAIAHPLAIWLNFHEVPTVEVSNLISLLSVSIFASAIVSAASSIFYGFEKMKLNSFTQILQAIVKTLLGPLLVFLGFGVLGAVLGAIVSIAVGGLISMSLVYFVLFRPLNKLKTSSCNIKHTLKSLLSYGIPLTLSTIVVSVLPQIFASFMARNAGLTIMGNYASALHFAVLVTFISFPISTALFPAFSKLRPEKEPEIIKTVFASSVKYTAFLLVPTIMLIMTLSTPLIYAIYPEQGTGIIQSVFTITGSKFPYAPLFLTLSSISNLFVLFGSVTLSAFQTGISKTKQMMKQSALSLSISLLFLLAMYGYFEIFGVTNEVFVVIIGIIGIILSTIPGMVWGLLWAWKNYRVKADFKNSGKIFVASVIASIGAYAFSTVVTAPYMILLFAGAIIFILIYLICAPLIGAVNQADIDNLKIMTSGLGPISKIVEIPLMLMRKICKNSNHS